MNQFDSRILVFQQEHNTEDIVKKATGDLVGSIGRLELEVNKKIGQIRQLIDETKDLRNKQDDRLNLLVINQNNYEERIKNMERDVRANI